SPMHAEPTGPDTIVLIHGLWMTPLSWENWVERYSNRGYRVLAPAWPGVDVEIDQLRADPSAIENLGIEEILDSYDAIIRELDVPPIIMGHSFGGALHRDTARPRPWRRRRSDRCSRSEGDHEASLPNAQVRIPRAQEPGQQ